MDPNKAIQFGQLVQATYAIPPANVSNSAGKVIAAAYDPFDLRYKVVTSIYGSDLPTGRNPDGTETDVSFGYVLQDKNNDVVVAIRGTQDPQEWVDDFQFLLANCPFLSDSGMTEDGFTTIYKSLRIALPRTASRLSAGLAGLQFAQPVGSLTICGHSLGGALATLLALDVAANSSAGSFKKPALYTYGSPRVGDIQFANKFNQLVKSSFRMANIADAVPTVPAQPLYEHVDGLVELSSLELGPPLHKLVKPILSCEHNLLSYLHLISLRPGVTIKQPLDPACVPLTEMLGTTN